MGQAIHAEGQALEFNLVRIMCCFAALYPIFLTLFKYRAAHHRKFRTWQTLGSRWQRYLKAFLLCEAKTTPINDPAFPRIWISLCYIFAWILFPRPVVLAFIGFGLTFSITHIMHAIYIAYFFKDTDNYVYNGQRYRRVDGDTHYSCFKDENQNTMYYPTIDICGLIIPSK
jgi:hypothetical protein